MRYKALKGELSELKASVDLCTNSTANPQPSPHATDHSPPQPSQCMFGPPVVPPPVRPANIIPASLFDEFVDETTADTITEYLSKSCTFNDENGHSVTSFGHPYSYIGSKATAETPAIPDVLQPIVDKINQIQADQFYDKYPDLKAKGVAPVINSCLVNRYNGTDSSLPEHSDNEIIIHPESSIFSISLGESCEIKFADMGSKTDNMTLKCSHRSLYQMTRKSQEFFSHRIEKGATGPGVRYSLTFRSVSWKNRNSTAIIGDSNTGKLAFGDSKFNSFSELMPGQRFWTAQISDIDPVSCCGYNNVVVSVGINDLKQSSVRYQQDIDQIYYEYKCKIKQIRQINAKSNIFVVPVLPTKNHDFNKRAIYFNSLIFSDLERSRLGVIHVLGLESLLDDNGLLSRRFSKEFDSNGRRDVLHLNENGVRRFAGMIKRSIFLKLNRGVDKRKGISAPDGTQRSPPRQVASPVGSDGYQS